MTAGHPGGATRFSAPAKLNLFLHVVGRRPDGYHLLQSAMQLVDLADELEIAVRGDGRIVRDGTVDGVAEADDLAIRAARLFRSEAGVAEGVTIAIHKRIPLGGGLGGGSSDAATTLLALNRLWQVDWPRQRLMELGARLGADVPFFIGGTSAFVEGIGERVTPLTLPSSFYAIVHPGIAVPTAAIFSAAELTRDSEIIKISDFSKSGSGASGRSVGEDPSVGAMALGNDLEAVAVARFDAVREALDWLSPVDRDSAGTAGRARMSGSGACVFRAFDCLEAAEECIATLPSKWSGWSVRSLQVHPHADCADG